MAGTLVGVPVGVGEANVVAAASAEAVGVVAACVVAVGDGGVGDATPVVAGADEGVPIPAPGEDWSGPATGVRGDVGETVAPVVAVAAFAVDAGDDDARRPVALAGGVVVGGTMGEGVDVPVGVAVCDAEGSLVEVGVGDAGGAAMDDS